MSSTAITSKDKGVLRQLSALHSMTLEQLHEKWRDLYGSEPPGLGKRHIEKRLAFRIQELFYGGLPETTKEKLQSKRKGQRNKRKEGLVLPGTRFVRVWNGKKYEVVATENGFEYNSRSFRSLSAVAREITGTRWNGRLFFGVRPMNKLKFGD